MRKIMIALAVLAAPVPAVSQGQTVPSEPTVASLQAQIATLEKQKRQLEVALYHQTSAFEAFLSPEEVRARVEETKRFFSSDSRVTPRMLAERMRVICREAGTPKMSLCVAAEETLAGR